MTSFIYLMPYGGALLLLLSTPLACYTCIRNLIVCLP